MEKSSPKFVIRFDVPSYYWHCLSQLRMVHPQQLRVVTAKICPFSLHLNSGLLRKIAEGATQKVHVDSLRIVEWKKEMCVFLLFCDTCLNTVYLIVFTRSYSSLTHGHAIFRLAKL